MRAEDLLEAMRALDVPLEPLELVVPHGHRATDEEWRREFPGVRVVRGRLLPRR
jgi:hypothetical protein